MAAAQSRLTARNASANRLVEADIDKAIVKVRGGTALSEALEQQHHFLLLVPQMSKIGEESGAIDDMLSRVADYYEAEVDDMVEGLSSLMEPIIIVFLGGLIGGIVVSMYLPIFKLGQVV